MTGPADPQTAHDTGALWQRIGPGIVVAATGIGAGDLLATLIAGSRYGYTLLWAGILGCIVKIALAEGTARWHLATGKTIQEGWQSLGRWTAWYFGIYIIVWGLVFGAAATSATALPLAVLMPVLPVWAWAMIVAVGCFAFTATNRYAAMETLMKVLIGLMFIIIVGLAVVVAPNLPALASGLAPSLPSGSAFYTLSLIGGVGGTITVAAYGYWVNAKGWRGADHLSVMRFDNGVAYAMTGIFVTAMLIVGAELLYSANIALATGQRGLLDLGAVLSDRFGTLTATAFLIGFAASALSSVLGVWHGVSLMFADFVSQLRRDREPATAPEKSPAFRLYLAWLTFAPMPLLFLDRPFLLVVTYGVVGAFFMPFLAGTLLYLLNSAQVPAGARNGWKSNGLLAIAALLFVILCGQQIVDLVNG